MRASVQGARILFIKGVHMSIIESQVTTFMSLFTGSSQGYGEHIYLDDDKDKVKKSGKSFTKQGMPKPEMYAQHLRGEKGLGIIPVEEGLCKFCEIDVDVYGEDVMIFVKAIWRNGLPLIPFRSKSGGLHMCTFYKDFIDADIAISNARRLASLLNVDKFLAQHDTKRAGAVEIFPKQKRVEVGRKGSWINLPYYNADNGIQCAIGMNGDMLFDDFLVYAQSHLQTPETVEAFFDNLPFKDAPPCLQTIYMLDAMEYTEGRNNYLHCFGTYLKKSSEEFWESRLYEINNAMSRPLGEEELETTVIQSLRKKDYSYMCTQSPCVLHCNKAVCKTREFGVGKDQGYFSTLEYGMMTQYKQDQPYYEWQVREQGKEDWTTFRFKDETEVIGQDKFMQLCMRFLHMLPPKLKTQVWTKTVNQCLQDLQVVEISEEYDMSPLMVFKSFLYDFIIGSTAKTREQVLSMGRVWYEEEDDTYIFKGADCLKYIRYKKNFTTYRESEYIAKLRDIGAVQARIRISVGKSSKQVSVWKLSKELFRRNVESAIGEADNMEVQPEQYEPEKVDEGVEF